MEFNENTLVTIIIPLYVIEDRFFRDIKHFDNLTHKNYEIIIVHDLEDASSLETRLGDVANVKLLYSGKSNTGPGEKRDKALEIARGDICAFIDDDAFPHENWITEALKHFNNEKIVGVGGPGVTPPESPYQNVLAGLVYESPLCSGQVQHRFVSKEILNNEIDDWPAYNLLVRTDILLKVGGYRVKYYGGEDTFLCRDLIKHGKLVYSPKAIVFHHRRSVFGDLQKQIGNIGFHRGFFFKKYPETSRRFFYLYPTLLTFGLIFLVFLALLEFISIPVFLGMFALIVLVGMFPTKLSKRATIIDAFLVSIGIITVHLSYGINFLKGLFTKEIER